MLLLSILSMSAQNLCEGNLGINIFENGDFGTGRDNVVQTDPDIAPGYTYITESKSPDDGFYTLTNSMDAWGFNFGSWISIGDNSEDPAGYMMVVNASFEPGLFYSQQVDGLCENTLYEFSADVINIVRIPVPDHIEPNIDFLIDDVFRFSTGDVPQDETWYKFGFTFTTEPGQTSVKLSLRNNAPGGRGNDLALDNISFQACGPDAFITTDQTIFLCEDDNTPTTIQAEIYSANQAVQWQFSSDSLNWEDVPNANEPNILHDIFDVGRYYYRYITAGTTAELMNEKCSIISDVLAVEVLPLNYEIDTTICNNESFEFGSQSLNTSGDYFESFISSTGCDSFVDLSLTVLPPEMISIDPTLIEPICFGDSNGSIQFNLTGGNSGPYIYDLGAGPNTSDLFENLKAGDYNVTITNNQGCSEIFPLTLTQPDSFTISLPNDTVIDLGELLDVEILANQTINSISWTPEETSPCGDCLEFSFLPVSSGDYIANAINEAGCQASDAFNVTLNIDDLDIYIPNVFSPSQNNINESFTIGAKTGLINAVNTFSVYDRWGNRIYNKEAPADLNLWNGIIENTPALPGIYTYVISLKLIDGNDYQFIGDILLLE